jgi:hypothetical protein
MPTYRVLDVKRAPLGDGSDPPTIAAALTIRLDYRFARDLLRMSPEAGGEPGRFVAHSEARGSGARPARSGPGGASTRRCAGSPGPGGA